jgi:hypothetical protein
LQNVIRTRFPNSKAGLENLFLRGFLLKEITMRKITSLLLITALTACGGGTVEPPKPQIVKLSAEAIAQLPPGFTIGPTASGIPPGPFVTGPVPTPALTPPPVEFVVGPAPTVVGPTPAVPFVVGPAVTVPSPVVIGPTPTVPFVAGPVAGPVVTVSPPVIIGPSRIVQPVINYCTDGFVVGPCTPLPTTCRPDSNGFVVGPCGN